jgi:hypothetical protein
MGTRQRSRYWTQIDLKKIVQVENQVVAAGVTRF